MNFNISSFGPEVHACRPRFTHCTAAPPPRAPGRTDPVGKSLPDLKPGDQVVSVYDGRRGVVLATRGCVRGRSFVSVRWYTGSHHYYKDTHRADLRTVSAIDLLGELLGPLASHTRGRTGL